MNSINPKPSAAAPSIKTIAVNRKARHEYHFLEQYEAGIALHGPEVKSLRAGRAAIADAYAQFQDGELKILGMNIPPYEQANRWNTDPTRPRTLLMHKQEMRRLIGKLQQRGLTLVPLRLYFKNSRVKVELALSQGKKAFDKRETIKRRDQEREMQREMRRARD